jgi:predicted O-methyltransferase YrrM
MGVRPGPDWFSNGYAQAAFERHLIPHFGQEDFHVLQIGAYCGDASVWLLNNVVTGSRSWLVDVDTWQGSNEADHGVLDFSEVEEFYLDQIKRYNHVGRFKGTSDEYFALGPAPFDFIYVDGAHTAEQVLRDAVNADRYLKVGGMIAFDDYKWGGGSRDVPAPAIDAFLRCYEQRYEVLEKDLQVWVRKVR